MPARVTDVRVAVEEPSTVTAVVLHFLGDAVAVVVADDVLDVVGVVHDGRCRVDVLDGVGAVVAARLQVGDAVNLCVMFVGSAILVSSCSVGHFVCCLCVVCEREKYLLLNL